MPQALPPAPPWITPPENYRQINAAAQMNDGTSVRSFYKRLVQLRKELDVISEGRIEFAFREDDRLLAYRRYTKDQQMLVLCNLTGEDAELTLPAGWEGAKVLLTNWDRSAVSVRLPLKPYEALALIM